ncbi:MAG TPA: ribonuclease D [Solirubrobacteraceae bacterium]|nr:ribonuclease D [Solirubrobacteraceae bacterium]
MSVTVCSVHEAQPPLVGCDDLDERGFEQAIEASTVALDIETTGLDWRRERICTVQMQVEDTTYVIRIGDKVPYRLRAIVEDAAIGKILHHAMFDLRFLAFHWGVTPAHVACTKIASKLAEPQAPCEAHSLAPLLQRHLGVHLDKSQRTSDWTVELSAEQLRYAADDVRYLMPLYALLDGKLRSEGRVELRDRCYAHLPTRVELEVGGFPDVFAY